MVTRSEVFEANKTTILLNMSKKHYWEEKDIKQIINEHLNHVQSNADYGVNTDISIEQYKNKLKEYINKCIINHKFLNQELNLERKTYIPSPKNIADFFAENELPFKNTFEYQRFLYKTFTELE